MRLAGDPVAGITRGGHNPKRRPWLLLLILELRIGSVIIAIKIIFHVQIFPFHLILLLVFLSPPTFLSLLLLLLSLYYTII